MLKSSELANGRTDKPRRRMIITQTEIGQETSVIKMTAPKTWQYLLNHAAYLDKRGSSIYRKRPRFSVFGVGGYAFTPWKIAISGFYKSLNFARIGSHQGKPVVLDDTGYLLACESCEEMDFLHELLTSKPAQEFYSSLIFWDAKRPITTDLLAALSLDKLAAELNCRESFERFSVENRWSSAVGEVQLSIF